MPIQLFSQLNFSTPASRVVGGSSSRNSSADALEREKLRRIQEENIAISKATAAATSAPITMQNEEGYTLNMGNESKAFDPDEFAQHYEREITTRLGGEVAAKYKTTLATLNKEQGLASKAQREAEEAAQTGMLHTMTNMNDYVTATGDTKGGLLFLNKAEKAMGMPQNEWTQNIKLIPDKGVMLFDAENPDGHLLDQEQIKYLGADLNTRLTQRNEMEKWRAEHGKKVSHQELTTAEPLRSKYLADEGYQNYKSRADSYSTMLGSYLTGKKSGNMAVADIGMVFNAFHIWDPQSTVREGEYATARNASGVPDAVKTMYNKLLSGDQLGEAQRKAFLRETKSIFENSKTIHDNTTKKQFDTYAKEAEVRPELVTSNVTFDHIKRLEDEVDEVSTKGKTGPTGVKKTGTKEATVLETRTEANGTVLERMSDGSVRERK